VLSGVFTAVQGFAAIALYCPVNDGEVFRGAIAVLVPFEKISKRYVERISIGAEGYAVLVDADGTILYSPVPGETGRLAAEAWSSAPQLIAALSPSVTVGEGEGEITFSESAGDDRRPERHHGYRVSSRIVDTAWTVLVRAPESEALGFILGFRNAWIALAASMVAAFAFWSAYLARSAARIRSANAALVSSNAALEAALVDLRSTQDRLVLSGKMAALGQVTASIAHQFNTPLAAIVSADEGIIHTLRDEFSEALEIYAALPPPQKEAAEAIWAAAAIAASAPPDRRLRTDRNSVAEAEARLSFEGVQAAGEIAELLADMGTLDRIDAVLPLIAGAEGRRFLRIIASFSSALGSSTIIKHAVEKASATVSALRTYVRADRSEGW
ncbi:MAG: hypothetical protein Q8M76_11035, partial [Spirochaetaceae bacterium]|nr:hypothetical protein [Spirochaetaceae bacterium]